MSASGLESVFLLNRDKLLRFLAAHGAGDAAEDLLQELWIKVAAAQTGPIAAPLSYLYRAANNLMLDRYRAERQSLKRDADWIEASGPAHAGISDAPSGERAAIARQSLDVADRALEATGARAALVFRRHRLDGVPQREIASELGVSLSTVESDLRKAYAALIAARRRIDEV